MFKKLKLFPKPHHRLQVWVSHHETSAAFVVALAIAAVVYAPLLMGKVAAPLQLLQDLGGWAPIADSAVRNDLISDVTNQILPYRQFTLDTLRAGQLPLWNDQLFNGEAFLANVQSTVLNPFNVLGFWLDTLSVHNVIVAAQLVFTLWFTYLFLRELKLGRGGAAVGAVTFALCSYLTVWAEWGNIGGVLCWLPLVLMLVHRYMSHGQLRDGLGLAAAFGAQFYFGHFQFSLYIGLTAAAFATYVWVARQISWRRVLPLGLFMGLGLTLAAPQILPALEASGISYRASNGPANYSYTYFQSQARVSLPQTILQLLHPTMYGTPVDGDFNGRHNYNEAASFIGIFALLLAVVGFFKGSREGHFFSGLAVISLAFATVSVVYYPVWRFIEPLQSLPAVRFLSLMQFALCMLAAVGADWLIRQTPRGLTWRWLAAAGVFTGVCSLVAWGYVSGMLTWPPRLSHHILYPWLGLLVGVAVVITGFRLRRPWLMAGFLTILCLVEGAVFLRSYLPFTDRQTFAVGNPAMAFVQQDSGDTRNYRIIGPTGLDFNMYYGLAQPTGYDSLFPRANETYQDALEHGSTLAAPNPMRFENTPSLRQLENLGVRYIITTTKVIPTLANVVTPPPAYELVWHDGTQSVYRHRSVVTTAYVVSSAVQGTEANQLQAITNDALATHQIMGNLPNTQAGAGGLIQQAATSGHYQFDVDMAGSGYVNLGQTYNAAWRATIDGQPVPVYKVNYNFAAVQVPNGHHTLRVDYAPNSFRYGLMALLVGIAGSLSLIGFMRFHQKDKA